MRDVRRPVVAVALIGGLVLALTGCSGDAADSAAPGGGGSAPLLDGCRVVTARMLRTDLGVGVSAPGQTSPSFYGRDRATDCAWSDGGSDVSVYASNDAPRDLPDGAIAGFLQAGGQVVPGADRSVARVTTDAQGTTVDLIVVRGLLGVEVSVLTHSHVTQDQAVTFGRHVTAALGSA